MKGGRERGGKGRSGREEMEEWGRKERERNGGEGGRIIRRKETPDPYGAF